MNRAPDYWGTPIDGGEIDEPVYLGDVDAPGFLPPQPALTPQQIAMAPPSPAEIAEEERMRAVDAYYGAVPVSPAALPAAVAGPEPPAARRTIEIPPVVVSDAPAASMQTPTKTAPSVARAAPRGQSPMSAVQADRAKVLGTFDTEKAGMERVATMQEDAAAMLAEKRAAAAREREEDAAIARLEQEKADRDFEAKFGEAQRQLDDVRAKKVDPTRLMKDDGVALLSVLGGVLGGVYQGLNKMDHNPFLRDLDIQIERDISAQQSAIDNARAVASDKMNLLSQQRAVFKDSQLAKLQARNLYYEAAKDSLEADAAKYEGRIEAERARLGITALGRAQADLKRQWDEAAAKAAAAQASAGFASAKAERKELRAAYLSVYDKAIGAGMPPQQAEAEAERAVQQLFMGGAPERGPQAGSTSSDPIALVPKEQRAEAIKERDAYETQRKVTKAIGETFEQWRKTSIASPRQRSSTRSDVAATIMKNVPGIRSDVDFKEIVEPNLPKLGDSEETLQLKERTLRRIVESGAPTPILDTHAPGWRGPQKVQRFDEKGHPIR